MLKQLHKGTEDDRRSLIIRVSSAKDSRYLPQLLARLKSNETYANRRHIVRALGNIGDASIERTLLELADTESGLICGDICEAFGKLRTTAARPILERFAESEEGFIATKARWALAQLKEQQS